MSTGGEKLPTHFCRQIDICKGMNQVFFFIKISCKPEHADCEKPFQTSFTENLKKVWWNFFEKQTRNPKNQ